MDEYAKNTILKLFSLCKRNGNFEGVLINKKLWTLGIGTLMHTKMIEKTISKQIITI